MNKTETEIEDLQAGDELDALVVERVMKQCAHVLGPKEKYRGPYADDNEHFHICNKCRQKIGGFSIDYEGRTVVFIGPSRDIKDAWKVVRHLQQGWAEVIVSEWTNGVTKEPNCQITVKSSPSEFYTKTYYAPAEVGICKAALVWEAEYNRPKNEREQN